MADLPDEIRENEYLERFPPPYVHTELCDTCLCQKEDTRLSPDENEFICVDCIGRTFENSFAVKRLLDISNHTREELSDWFYRLKL